MQNQSYKEALANFISLCREREEKHMKENFSNLSPKEFTVNSGRKFDKVVRDRSVFAFINKETGAIVKPASWKSPEPKQRERGNIFSETPLAGTSEYGVNYL